MITEEKENLERMFFERKNYLINITHDDKDKKNLRIFFIYQEKKFMIIIHIIVLKKYKCFFKC